MLILASQSPRRTALLRAAGIEHRVVPPLPAAERAAPTRRSTYSALVRRSALSKARSVSQRLLRTGGDPPLVLGADTIVVCRGHILGKPRSPADARRILRLLSGRRHSVYTGVALLCGTRYITAYQCTQVTFRALGDREISLYIESGEPMDKAGAYAVQGAGAAFLRVIRGCYTNVIGLPIPKVMDMLAAFAKVTDATAGAGASRGRRPSSPPRPRSRP
jgi:septum formation protein